MLLLDRQPVLLWSSLLVFNHWHVPSCSCRPWQMTCTAFAPSLLYRSSACMSSTSSLHMLILLGNGSPVSQFKLLFKALRCRLCVRQAREKMANHISANEAAIKAARLAAKQSKASAEAAQERLTAAHDKAALMEQQLSSLQVSISHSTLPSCSTKPFW